MAETQWPLEFKSKTLGSIFVVPHINIWDLPETVQLWFSPYRDPPSPLLKQSHHTHNSVRYFDLLKLVL